MTAIQSVYFLTSDRWTSTTARAWLKKNDIKPTGRVRKEGERLSYTILPKSNFKTFKTKVVKGGIHLVIGHAKGQKGGSGSGLSSYGSFLGEQFRSTGYLSSTANELSQLPFTPNWGAIMLNVASDQLRKQGY